MPLLYSLILHQISCLFYFPSDDDVNKNNILITLVCSVNRTFSLVTLLRAWKSFIRKLFDDWFPYNSLQFQCQANGRINGRKITKRMKNKGDNRSWRMRKQERVQGENQQTRRKILRIMVRGSNRPENSLYTLRKRIGKGPPEVFGISRRIEWKRGAKRK